MRLLLDTHTFIWWANEPEYLSNHALHALEDEHNELILSVVSAWELQIKMQLGKLELKSSLKELISKQVDNNDMVIMPVGLDHVYALENLPPIHRDPFDRLLIAQAISEDITLVTKDAVFKEYSAQLLW